MLGKHRKHKAAEQYRRPAGGWSVRALHEVGGVAPDALPGAPRFQIFSRSPPHRPINLNSLFIPTTTKPAAAARFGFLDTGARLFMYSQFGAGARIPPALDRRGGAWRAVCSAGV